MRGFGRRAFELMLLRRMEDFHPDLVSAAVLAMGSTRAELRAAHRRWTELMHSRRYPSDVRRFELALGPADAERNVPFGDVQLVARQWALPVLWPDLAWEVLTDGDGAVLQEWLVRVSGRPAQDLGDLCALEPWCCVVGDLADAHPGARDVDLQVGSRWGLVIGDTLATFSWGLFQQIGPAQ